MKCKHLILHGSVTLLALTAIVLATPRSVQSQNMPAQNTPQQNAAPAPDQNNGNINRNELLALDEFLQTHPEIAEPLRKNPTLIDDQRFVANHPELLQFLTQHPGTAQAYEQHPNLFMHDEERFQRDDDITRRELAAMNQFLDKHPEIAEQLRRDPTLLDNKQWVANHPAVQQFLSEHPRVTEAYEQNSRMFMRDEDRFGDQQQDDITRRDLATMNEFLDKHPEIGEQLRKDPSLVDDKRFVANHPAFQQFLSEHPEVAKAYEQKPDVFMRDEERYEHHETAGTGGNNDAMRGGLASFHEFLSTHEKIGDELSKDPSLANNKEYLETHGELRDYLQANPQVHQELSENPQAFMTAAENFNGGMPNNRTAKVNGESKPK
jgi:hypothetical protein